MIQAFGLTSNPRKAHPPAVDDVSFEVRAGQVTALLGRAGAGKTTTLKLMLELQPGRGITYFRGRPLHRIAHPAREVGVLLGDVPGHPARSVRGHLRMLCAATGVAARRADEVLEVVGLVSLREERLGTLSRGMDRRLGLACALLSDPHTLVVDEPADGLSVREAQWLHGMLRAHATQGGTVLFTTAEPKEAARTADRVVTLDGGRLVADQEARAFARTRLRPRVAVRSPHAARLAALVAKDARTSRRSVEVVREDGNRLSVYGSTTADVGEIAFRHGILVHQLAYEVGDMGPGAGAEGVDGEPRPSVPGSPRADRWAQPERGPAERGTAASGTPREDREHAPAGRVRTGHGPTAPGRTTLEPAPEAGRSGLVGSSADRDRDMAEASAKPEHAGPAVSREAGTGCPVSEPRPEPAASGGTGPGPAAAGHQSAAVDRTAPDPYRPAQDFSSSAGTANGHPAGQREQRQQRAVAAPPSPDAVPAVEDQPPGERKSASGRGLPAWASDADGGRTHAVDQRTGADHRMAVSGARDASPAAGTAHDAAASGAQNPVGRGQARAGDGRSADSTAAARTAPGQGTPTREPRPGDASAPATALTGSRTLLPGARNPGARQPQPGHAARTEGVRAASSPLPPPISVRPAPSPLRPLRYEIRRAAGIGTGFVTCGAALAVSALIAVLLARIGHTPQARLFGAWPRQLPLPPAALAAGLLGALAFGDEFRHPALAADRGTVPRRLGLLTAKLLVSGAAAALLAFLTVGCDAEVLYVVYGRELTEVPADWLSLTAGWFGLVVGCAWAGVLAAGVFRSTTAGLAAVLAVPVLVVPLAHKALQGPAARLAADFPVRMREVYLLQWPFGGDRYLLAVARVLAQPVGGSLALSLLGLLAAYLCTALRTRLR
ncbi:ATP-binding cassette domain-containing protein [Streptomyces sp. NPDC017082]|uniref:ABC transporter ATP-binding protein n=1 Tax=Streptomyces sp. NPDC017082 TaxID=3364974 RepID=UPI00379C9CFB